jgi:hypothetical protein
MKITRSEFLRLSAAASAWDAATGLMRQSRHAINDAAHPLPLTADIRYAEFHEQALFNHVLGSMDPTDGATCYMVPVGRGARREYADMQRSFTCCVGTSIERAHNQQGEDTSIVRVGGRPARRVAKWFSYDLPIADPSARALVVTYNRDNRRARSFKILVDGEQLAEEAFPFDSESRFFDREYALPRSLVQDKARVTIRFEATGPNEIAPVFSVRVIR